MQRYKGYIMANKKIELKKVVTTKVSSKIDVPKKLKTAFVKKSLSSTKFEKSFTAWKKDIKQPKVKLQKIDIKPVNFTTKNLDKFVKVRTNKSATAALDKYYKQDLPDFVSMAHTSQMVLAYSNMKEEYAKRKKRARTRTEKIRLKKQWNKIVDAAVIANKISYGKDISEKTLDRMALNLKKNKKALSEVKNLTKSIKTTSSDTLTLATTIVAELVPVTAASWAPIDTVIPVEESLCDSPISGTLTKHYSNSFSITVKYPYWCPTWSNPLKTCTGSVTLAGVSFSMGIEVFYEISCCGAIAGGSAYVNACGTIIGITRCAGCRANVVAVGGIGHTPVNNECRYGLGAKADISCKVGSYTVFYAAYSFGIVVDGPCPPDVLPC